MKKKKKDRRVTIVVHTDGELESRQWRVPLWAFEAGKWGALVMALLVVLFFAFAGPISRAAARVPGGQVRAGDPAESHPGIDIAVPAGTPVRAAGGGVVEAAGADSAYGLFVLLRHSGGYETMYGHASRLLVHEGDSVQAGQVIALSGSSGRSTAPHLHFEIRREGKSLDPLTVVKQEN